MQRADTLCYLITFTIIMALSDKIKRWLISSSETFFSGFLAGLVFQIDTILTAIQSSGTIPTKEILYAALFAAIATGIKALFKKTRESRKNSYYKLTGK
jgi:hypothetical protein